MGGNADCSWADGKRDKNIVNHAYDFADLQEVFDGRFAVLRQDTRVLRQDTRFNYGELRYNMLTEFAGRIANLTFTPRAGKKHLISARPAGQKERKIYYTCKEAR